MEQISLLLSLLFLGEQLRPNLACQLPSDWRPLSEGCRAELAATIVYAKVLALHQDTYSMYNYLPWQYEALDGGLFYSAEIEMLCDQAWGSMLEVPAGSRLNLTGLGYFSCHSHTVMQDYSYFFFLRMDENYNLLPHGVNFQDAIFPDTQENRRIFSSLFQFSNCSQGLHAVMFSSDWEAQEDNRVDMISGSLFFFSISEGSFMCHLGEQTSVEACDFTPEIHWLLYRAKNTSSLQLMCSSLQKALFDEEDHVKKLQQKVAALEKRNKQLQDRVKKVKRLLRQTRKNGRHMELINQKLNEKLSSTGGQFPYANSLKQGHSRATYLKV